MPWAATRRPWRRANRTAAITSGIAKGTRRSGRPFVQLKTALHEGRLRQAAWVNGEFADEVILGMLAAGWAGGGSRQPGEDEIPDRSS